MSPMHAEHCQDDSVHGAPHGNVNVNKITLPPTRDLILGAIIALSLLGDVFLYSYAKDAKTQAWLAEDQLNKFMTNQLPQLETRIEVTEALTNAYGLKKETTDVGRNHH